MTTGYIVNHRRLRWLIFEAYNNGSEKAIRELRTWRASSPAEFERECQRSDKLRALFAVLDREG